MAFAPVFQRPFSPTFDRHAAAAAAAANWWEVAGKTCVAAYQPKGAASLAASYTNLANPGTYDAAPGVAPSWTSGAGWSFDGSSSYLATGLVPSTGWSHLAQYTDAGGSGYIVGSSNGYNYFCFRLRASDGAIPGLVLYETGNAVQVSPSLLSGNLALAGLQGYRDGVADGSPVSSSTWSATQGLYLGGVNLSGSLNGQGFFTLVAYAAYSDTLDATEVATVAAAMAAL